MQEKQFLTICIFALLTGILGNKDKRALLGENVLDQIHQNTAKVNLLIYTEL